MSNNFTAADLVERIYLTLPTRFTRDDTSNVYAVLYGLATAFKFNSDYIDEFFAQTNLDSSSGAYVDDHINGLIRLGRLENETDADYKTRYRNITFSYGCSKSGMETISIEIVGVSPYAMYAGLKRGAFWNGRYYYNDDIQRSIYGSGNGEPFTGYIVFSRKPNATIFEELCRTFASCKAAGITIYLKYPIENDLIVDVLSELEEGSGERIVIS